MMRAWIVCRFGRRSRIINTPYIILHPFIGGATNVMYVVVQQTQGTYRHQRNMLIDQDLHILQDFDGRHLLFSQ